MRYQIKIRGELDQSWSKWLGDAEITVTMEKGRAITILDLEASDQPALFGILDRIRDSNLSILSLTSGEAKGFFEPNSRKEPGHDND